MYQNIAYQKHKNIMHVWDDKNGHVMSRAEVTGFLIDKFDGMTNIFKQYL
jgi:hypothetical protein